MSKRGRRIAWVAVLACIPPATWFVTRHAGLGPPFLYVGLALYVAVVGFLILTAQAMRDCTRARVERITIASGAVLAAALVGMQAGLLWDWLSLLAIPSLALFLLSAGELFVSTERAWARAVGWSLRLLTALLLLAPFVLAFVTLTGVARITM